MKSYLCLKIKLNAILRCNYLQCQYHRMMTGRIYLWPKRIVIDK